MLYTESVLGSRPSLCFNIVRKSHCICGSEVVRRAEISCVNRNSTGRNALIAAIPITRRQLYFSAGLSLAFGPLASATAVAAPEAGVKRRNLPVDQLKDIIAVSNPHCILRVEFMCPKQGL